MIMLGALLSNPQNAIKDQVGGPLLHSTHGLAIQQLRGIRRKSEFLVNLSAASCKSFLPAFCDGKEAEFN